MTIAIGDLLAKVTKNADGTYALVSPAEVITISGTETKTVFTGS